MKSLTVYNMEPALYEKIEQLAKEQGISQNKTIKRILMMALNIVPSEKQKIDFSSIYGMWQKEDDEEISKALEDTRQIDLTAWQ